MSSVRNGHASRLAPLLAADRQPPHNIDAEEALLGGLLLDPVDFGQVAAILDPADFFRDDHATVFRAMIALRAQGQPIDMILLAEALRRREGAQPHGGGLRAEAVVETLAALAGAAPHAANVVYHAQVVREKAIARETVAVAENIIEETYSNLHTAADVVRRGLDQLVKLEVDSKGDTIGPQPWPDPPGSAAWNGVAGEIVRLIEPHTEADPVAILVQLLVAFGNVVGRGPHWKVEATRHGLNLFACIVGDSSKARKGTSWDHVLHLVGACDPRWKADRIFSGLSSGEGLIWTVRDRITRSEPRKSGKQVVGYKDVEVDPGVSDKRVTAVETEFGATLGVMIREGNTLSGMIRKAWDSGTFGSMTKNSPARTTDAHVSIIGHITGEELARRLTHTDVANGFANRFLWVCARRSKCLPRGGQAHTVDFSGVVRRLRDAAEWAREEEWELVLDAAAARLWEDVYPVLSQARPGLIGAVTSRAEAQAMRLANVYATLDQSSMIGVRHLEAGLALWRYCDQSARFIFGESLGNKDAEAILKALEEAEDTGLTRTQIMRHVFRGHRSEDEIARSLGILSRGGLAQSAEVPTGGRPRIVWFARGQGAK